MPEQIIYVTLEEFLNSKTSKPNGEDGCWEWDGPRDRGGYGRLSANGRKPAPLSRVVVKHFKQIDLADDQVVRHTCDNPPCWNPSHLVPGTHTDNMRDRAVRGRHPNAKLSADAVEAMRREYSTGAVSQKELAVRYGVSQSAVSRAVHGKLWEHVEAPVVIKTVIKISDYGTT